MSGSMNRERDLRGNRRAALAPMLGTPYAAWFLRLLGCQIGKWVFIETTSPSEIRHLADKIGDRRGRSDPWVDHPARISVRSTRVTKIGCVIEIGDYSLDRRTRAVVL